VVGVNYYWNNQWLNNAEPLSPFDSARYRPLHLMLEEVYRRYERPMFIAETSIEGAPRPTWLRFVAEEVREAMRRGVPLHGICLYPVISHIGWDNNRYCANGLFELEPRHGRREVCRPLADELRRQNEEFAAMDAASNLAAVG
jgi:hypothetical protein